MQDSVYDTARWARRRRDFDRLEGEVVRRYLRDPGETPTKLLDGLRYVLSFARLTQVRSQDGVDIDLDGLLQLHGMYVRDQLTPRLNDDPTLWTAIRALPDLVQRTRRIRQSLLQRLPLDRDSLEEEVTTRKLAVASGGGGGAGFSYFGCYEMMERYDLVPDLMVGTSIGSLTSLFRCRRRRFDPAPAVGAARRLAWSDVVKVMETESQYGLPATLRLYLREALASFFRGREHESLWLSDLEIPLYIIATGITVDALKHDMDYYEHLLDSEVGATGVRGAVRGLMKSLSILREFFSRRDALKEIVLGRMPGTEDFDALDAVGFSSSVPGVLHYDVLRNDERMWRLLNTLYATHGITRLGEGGLLSNVPARVAWESVMSGRFGRRNVLVIALDCFAPNSRMPAWYALQTLVRNSNVEADKAFADVYIPLPRTLSPANLVPALRDALEAMRWGREALADHMPYIQEMMRPIPVLSDVKQT